MALPPGREAKPWPGIEEETGEEMKPGLYAAAGELNAWIDYLLDFESHDGPRIYRGWVDGAGGEPVLAAGEYEERVPERDRDPHWAAYSVLEGYEWDKSVFFTVAEGVGCVREKAMEDTYMALTRGYLTKDDSNGGLPGDMKDWEEGITFLPRNPVLDDWDQMRKGWIAPEDDQAFNFEKDFVGYQVLTDRCFYVVAEHMVKYVAIFKEAARQVAELMTELTERLAASHRAEGPGFNGGAMLLTGLVAVGSTVITGGSAAVALGSAVVSMLGEAAKDETTKSLQLHQHPNRRSEADEFLEEIAKIEAEVYDAVQELYGELQDRLDEIRRKRTTYRVGNVGVPHVSDYREARG